MKTRIATLAAALAVLSGCACDAPPDAALEKCSQSAVFAGSVATDILFVIDDSGSMAGEQADLAQNLYDFIDLLLTTSAVTLDLHVGVTNASVTAYSGGSGSYGLQNPAGDPFPGAAGTPYPAGAIVAIEQDGTGAGIPGSFVWGFDPSAGTSTWGGLRILSSGPTLGQDFKANVLQGDWGSGKEQPLAAMRLAIEKSGAGGVNAGFRRPGARLAVVIVTDEDDCSESQPPYEGTNQTNCQSQTNKDQNFDPLADFVTLLDTTVGGEPLVAVIAGFDPATLDPTGCSSGGSSSFQSPTRLNAFVAALDATHPGRTHKDSICNQYGPALTAIAEKLVPQRILLDEAPADPNMLAVKVVRADGSTQVCTQGTDVVFAPPQAGAPASLTFQNACRLAGHDRVDINIVCVR
jgi:hypothetical protein